MSGRSTDGGVGSSPAEGSLGAGFWSRAHRPGWIWPGAATEPSGIVVAPVAGLPETADNVYYVRYRIAVSQDETLSFPPPRLLQPKGAVCPRYRLELGTAFRPTGQAASTNPRRRSRSRRIRGCSRSTARRNRSCRRLPPRASSPLRHYSPTGAFDRGWGHIGCSGILVGR